MSFLKKLARAFVEVDEGPPKPGQPPATLLKTLPAGASIVSGVSAPAPAAIDAALHASLTAATLNRKTVLTGLIEQSEKLRAVIPDDRQRIQAAAAVTANVTVDAVTQAAAAHIADLNNQRNTFDRELTIARASEVDAVRARAQSTETQALAAQAEIERLQASIATLTAQAQQLHQDADRAAAELDTQAANFEQTFSSVQYYIETTRDSVIGVIGAKH
jgi:chromosome segregation ATPase